MRKSLLVFVTLSLCLAFSSVRAHAQNNPPPLGPILDLSGTPIPGGGNSTYQTYTVDFTGAVSATAITLAFREDPAFISVADVSVTDTTTSSGNLLTNGDFSGGTYLNNGNAGTPNGWTYANIFGATFGGFVASDAGHCYTFANCWYDGAVQSYDAISQTIATTVGDNYHISFSLADNSLCDSNGGGSSCNFSDISTNGDVTDTGGNGINATVYAQEGIPLPATPEPGTLSLILIGILSLGFVCLKSARSGGLVGS